MKILCLVLYLVGAWRLLLLLLLAMAIAILQHRLPRPTRTPDPVSTSPTVPDSAKPSLPRVRREP